MKLYATIENEKGKRDGIGGNEYLYIDVRVGNQLLSMLTVQVGESGGWELSSQVDGIDYIVPSYERELKNKGQKAKGENGNMYNPYRKGGSLEDYQ